jgi:ppGpp synthetase/RelA/SpoT-type nucleotidyltranferase
MASPWIDRYEARRRLLEGLQENLERETKEAVSANAHVDRVVFRVKGAQSFAEKAEDPENSPPYIDPLIEIEDQIAGRILVYFLSDLAPIEERLRETFTTVERSERRPARDAEFGYESNHLICVIPPHVVPNGWTARADLPTTFEIQIRTLFMHAYAQPQHRLAYKAAQELPPAVRRELGWMAASAWGADRAYERVRRMLEADPPKLRSN